MKRHVRPVQTHKVCFLIWVGLLCNKNGLGEAQPRATPACPAAQAAGGHIPPKPVWHARGSTGGKRSLPCFVRCLCAEQRGGASAGLGVCFRVGLCCPVFSEMETRDLHPANQSLTKCLKPRELRDGRPFGDRQNRPTHEPRECAL